MRTPTRILAAILAVTAITLAAAVVWRTELAETAARSWLARKGLAGAKLDVVALTASRVVLRDIELGDGAPSAARVEIAYTLSSLWSGALRRVEIDGPRLNVDLGAERPLAFLQPFLDGSGQAAGPPPALPEILLRHGIIVLDSSRGTVDVRFDGEATSRDGEISASLRGEARAGHTALRITANAVGSPGNLALSVSAEGESDLAEVPWPAAWAVQPTAGRMAFRLAYDGPLPTGVPAQLAATLDRPSAGRLSVSLEQADVMPFAEGIEADLTAGLQVRGGALLIRLQEPATIAARRVRAPPLIDLGLESTLASLVASTRAATLASGNEDTELIRMARREGAWQASVQGELRAHLGDGEVSAALAGTATMDDGLVLSRLALPALRVEAAEIDYGPHALRALSFDGRGAGRSESFEISGELTADLERLALGAQTLRDIRLNGPLHLAHARGRTTAALTGPGRLLVERLPDTAPVHIAAPLRVGISAAGASRSPAGLEAEARIDPGKVVLTLPRAGAPDMDISAATGPISLRLRLAETLRIEAGFTDGTARLPSLKLHARGVEATFSHGDAGTPLAQIAVDRLLHEADPAAFAPLALDLTARLRERTVRAEGKLRVRNTGVSVPLRAEHRLDTEEGNLAFGPVDLDFRPGTLQPLALSGLLAMVGSAKGQVSVDGGFEWSGAGLESHALVRVAGLDLTTDHGTLEGLAGSIAFTRLLPPRTPGDQELTASRVVAGVPLSDMRLRFRLDSDAAGAPVFHLARMEGHLAEGTVSVKDTALRSFAKATDLTLHIENLSLARLLRDLAVEGLAGEGTLAGRIPVRIGGNGVIVDQGKLAAVTGGVLRVRFRDAKRALAGQGEQVELMLRALEDFRYSVLEMTVDRPAGADLELGIHLEGRNPAVLDGYPFRFNISLTGDVAPILLALQEGRRLSGELLQRAIEAR